VITVVFTFTCLVVGNKKSLSTYHMSSERI